MRAQHRTIHPTHRQLYPSMIHSYKKKAAITVQYSTISAKSPKIFYHIQYKKKKKAKKQETPSNHPQKVTPQVPPPKQRNDNQTSISICISISPVLYITKTRNHNHQNGHYTASILRWVDVYPGWTERNKRKRTSFFFFPKFFLLGLAFCYTTVYFYSIGMVDG